jgi:hypothetical protein
MRRPLALVRPPVRTNGSLGHASPEITREIYIGSVPENAREAVEGVERLLATRGSPIGPKRTQVPVWPKMGSALVN